MKIRLLYFDARGRAELCRLIMAYGKVEYEDVRIQGPDWPALKPTLPFGTMPVLEVDGVYIGQTIAINGFLARKTGLAGKTEVEQGLAEAIVDHVKDISTDSFKSSGTDEEKKKFYEDFFSGQGLTFLKRMESMLQKNGGRFFVGKGLTYADIAMAHLIGFFEGLGDGKGLEVVSQHPLIAKHKEMVFNLDGIKEWIANRPQTRM